MHFVTGIWRNVIRNTVLCLRNLGIQNAVCHRNLENCNAKYGNLSERFRNTGCSFIHRNLDSCKAKYFNVSEEFSNSECSLSPEFREM
jgi:hypothetical protein